MGSGAMWVMELKRAHFYSKVFSPNPEGVECEEQEVKPSSLYISI